MTEAQRVAKEAELADLRRKLERRTNVPGFAENVRALKERIVQLEDQLAG